MNNKMWFSKEKLVASFAFAFFVVCPRMAGIIHVISNYSDISILWAVLFGMIISIPLLVLMVYFFEKVGVWGALGFCILTDLFSSLFMKSMSIRAGIETFIIAIFVVIGVKLTPYISKIIFK